MEYGLTRLVLSSTVFVPLSKDEYEAIKSATDSLLEIIYMEEKFDILIENLIEFEKELVDSSISMMLQGHHDHRWFQEQRRLLNRRLMNLLSSAKTYIDHVPKHFRNVRRGTHADVERVKDMFNQQSKARLGYRVMEALRNHAQHAGYPIHSADYNSERCEIGLRHSINPWASPSEFRSDRKIDKALLAELDGLGDKINIKQLVRDFVEGLWAVHSELRQINSENIKNWKEEIISAIDRYKSIGGDDEVIGLAAVIKVDRGGYDGAINIMNKFIDYLDFMMRKNFNFSSLKCRYVSSEITKPSY